VIRLAHGQRAARRSRRRRPPRAMHPAAGKIRSRSRLGSRMRARPVRASIWSSPGVRRPGRRSRSRSGSGQSQTREGCAGRCPSRSGYGLPTEAAQRPQRMTPRVRVLRLVTACRSQRRYVPTEPAILGVTAGQAAIAGPDLAPRNAPQRVGSHRFKMRIMPLTWVELWGFEPQTSCMP
jgi:hypothetical protein